MFLREQTSILCPDQEAKLLKLLEVLRQGGRRILILQQKQKRRALLIPIGINSSSVHMDTLFMNLWGMDYHTPK